MAGTFASPLRQGCSRSVSLEFLKGTWRALHLRALNTWGRDDTPLSWVLTLYAGGVCALQLTDFLYDIIQSDRRVRFTESVRTGPGESSEVLYLSQSCQGFIDGGRLHQPLTLGLRLGDSFRSSEIAQGQRTAWRQSWHFVWALHLQRHHQVRPRTAEEEEEVVMKSEFHQLDFLLRCIRAPLRVHLGRGDLSVLFTRLHDGEDVGLGLDLDPGQSWDRHRLPLDSDVQSSVGAFGQKVVQSLVINLQHGNLKMSRSLVKFSCWPASPVTPE